MRHATFVTTCALTAVVALPAMAQKTVLFGVGSPPRAHLVQQIFIPWSQKGVRRVGWRYQGGSKGRTHTGFPLQCL